MADDRFTPIILAAGRGSRMGGPKALLAVEGQTALERCVATCRAAAARLASATEQASAPDAAPSITPPIVVCGHGAAQVRERFEREPDLLLVLNADPDRGQTSSVQTGLTALPPAASGFFIFPVDHPLVADDDLVALARAAAGAAETLIVRPSHGGRAGHPVLIRRALCGEILALGTDEPLR